MYALMVEGGTHKMPLNWDKTLLHRALQILRSDPSVATGYAPMELILGRKPVWPIELKHGDIDLSGTELTSALVDALGKIHDNAFGISCKNIKKEQEKRNQKTKDTKTRKTKKKPKRRKNQHKTTTTTEQQNRKKKQNRKRQAIKLKKTQKSQKQNNKHKNQPQKTKKL